MMRTTFSLTLPLLLGLGACALPLSDPSLSLTPNGDHFVATGVIDHTTPRVVRQTLADHPDIRTIVLKYVPGSADDDANLAASRLLREAGVTTIVPAGGLVASGGTDMFLAGAQRRIGPGACLGVHSWGYGWGSGQGRDLPRDDPEHQVYLEYYTDMGVDTEFYWYTLAVADADDIHYMTRAELGRFAMATAPLPAGPEVSAARCDAVAMMAAQ